MSSQLQSRADVPLRRSSIDGLDELFRARLLIVTGKGGVGKTTVTAALGLAAAASGRRTLLVEVEGRQGLSRSFRTQPWDYEEREFRPGLFGLAVDPEESMYEYLDMYYGLRRVSWVMSRTNAVDFVTAAAPGLRDLLLVGKVYEIEKRRRSDGRPTYDVIILDAPPTGRIVPFLRAPEGVAEIARIGPIRRQSARITELLEDPARTNVMITTLFEELPVTETVEAVQQLTGQDIAVGAVVANQALRPRFDDVSATALAELDAARVAELTAGVGLELTPEAADLSLRQARAHRSRIELQEEMRQRLEQDADAPLVELPLLTGATFDEDDLEVLADVIARAVGAPGPRASGL
jgi:anion-transporting  ArsA/GET3 family ATPase